MFKSNTSTPAPAGPSLPPESSKIGDQQQQTFTGLNPAAPENGAGSRVKKFRDTKPAAKRKGVLAKLRELLAPKKVVTPKPGRRGWFKKGGGHAGVVVPAPEWRATSVQVCGLYPFGGGTGTPLVGAPLGRHLDTGATVCADPVSWFAQSGFIPNPSMIAIGRPGLGKSSLVRRICTILAGYGVTPLVFGDLKPDYVALIEELGGNIVRLGRGRGCLNVLDPGAAFQVANRLREPQRSELLADVRGRRLSLLGALLTMNRQATVHDHEEAIIAAALDVIDARYEPGKATLSELIAVIEEGPDAVRRVTLDRGDDDRYKDATDGVLKSLTALSAGALGEVFGHETTVEIDLTKPICIDISGIPKSEKKLRAAVLLACWTEGFGAISALQALTDAGLEKQRNFVVILDELWEVLGSGAEMADYVDAITRLDRATGVGTIFVTHTLGDQISSKQKNQPGAGGLAERVGMLAVFGVPVSEIRQVRNLVKLSDAEAETVTSWSTPAEWDPKTGRRMDPPGMGKVLIKVGGRAGIPVQVKLTDAEKSVNDTNTKWDI